MLVELFAAVASNSHFGKELYGKRVVGLVDSEPALDSIIKGLSAFDDIIELLTAFWNGIAENQISFYADKVSTDSNLSDLVSRDDFTVADRCGWDRVDVKLPEELERRATLVSNRQGPERHLQSSVGTKRR